MKIIDTFHRLIGRGMPVPDSAVIPRGIISPEEMRAAAASFDIYRGAAPWLGNGGCGLELASGISSELARLTLTEFSCGFQRSRAGRFLENALSPFLSRLRIYTEYACATGGVMFKPGYDGKALSCECILPFDFIPLGTDGAGEITDCAFLYYFRDGGQFYTRIETHRRAGGGYMVTNRAYRSDRGYGLGDEVPLSSVDGWAGITPDVFIAGLGAPLFAYFGIPLGNAFSPSSPLGVPVFRRAEGLIKQADLQFGRLLWEFEGGELAVDASEDAFRTGRDGKPELPPGKERLYRSNALDACSSSAELLSTFSPALRDKSFINGMNRIIMAVEDACGIARGTFSDPSEIARTATEVRSMRQRTYSTVCDIQRSLGNALERLVLACGSLAELYGLADGGVTADISFGDGVLTDSVTDRENEREDVKAGIISPEVFRERWYGESRKDDRDEKRIS